MSKHFTYEEAESHYKTNDHTRRCINGKTTGCNNCVGYCNYENHRGYLTTDLRKQHDCIGKNCYYYAAKLARQKTTVSNSPFEVIRVAMEEKAKKVLHFAQNLTADYEGMQFVKAHSENLGKYVLSYVTVSNDYPLKKIADVIESEFGIEIELEKKNYSFDRAAEIIFGRITA